MLAMRIDRGVFMSAILSAGMVLGCGSEKDEIAELFEIQDEGRKAAKIADYPPCGRETPFSLALTGMYNGVVLDETFVADSYYFPPLALWLNIVWGDSEFIAFKSLETTTDDMVGPWRIVGQLQIGPDRSQLDSIINGSVLTLDPEQKVWKLYLRTVHGTITGVLCNNR